jgi:diaminopimelate epimerase
MTTIRFTKMHGLGNDFMVVNAIAQPYLLKAEQIRQLANRNTGIGFDQLLLIEPPRHSEMDFFYRIFNIDGSEAEQCGNGLRCITHYLQTKQLSFKNPLRIGTLKGLHLAEQLADGSIKVIIGKPSYVTGLEELQLGGQLLKCFSLNLGNPHTVIQVPNIKAAPIGKIGALFNSHPHFPNGVNVEFMQVETPSLIRLRVFERAVGETLACGSGACAAVVAGQIQGLLATKVRVELPGGSLLIETDSANRITMLGPAVTVYEGEVTL